MGLRTRRQGKKGRSALRQILLFFGLLFTFSVKGKAAFPADMDVRPVTAYPVGYDTVTVYADAALSVKTGEADGGKLALTAYRVEGNAIYGDYTCGDAAGSGWFSLDVFVADPSYENVYGTIRDAAYVYTDTAFDQVRAVIRKYSGVIAVSKEGGDRQVIYETEDGYGIGWMTEGTFSNCLIYDGREKQALADGNYLLRCGYQDDAEGGAGLKKQTALADYDQWKVALSCLGDGVYTVENTADGTYLCVEADSDGYRAVWTADEAEKTGFRFLRLNGAFCLQDEASGYFLGEEKGGGFVLGKTRSETNFHWRVSALSRVGKKSDPMVFTQYDPAWCATPYGGGGCMGTAGCGVLAAVNAVYALSGEYMDVMELADYAVEKNYRIVGSGTDDGIFKAACKKFGRKYNFAWDGSGGSIDALKEKLAAGDVAVAHVEGHYVCIVGYNKKKKKFLLLDSNYLPKRATSAFGDWVGIDRLLSGSLEVQSFYYFKLRDAVE